MNAHDYEYGPPEIHTDGVMYHCKVCCVEFEEQQTPDDIDLGVVGDFTCGYCGEQAVLGELEPGACSLCGLVRDSGQVALMNWHIEGQEDMTCSSCMEANA